MARVRIPLASHISFTSTDLVALLKARPMLRLDQLIVGPALVG